MSLGNLDIADLQWRKARRSANNGACVEVAAAGLRVLVRDTKDQDGPVMRYSSNAWRAFLAHAKADRFHPESL